MKCLICLFLICTLSISSTAHAAEIRTVALSGQQVPGAPDGVTYSNDFRAPVLNDIGQTAFLADLVVSSFPTCDMVGAEYLRQKHPQGDSRRKDPLAKLVLQLLANSLYTFG